MSKKTKQRKSRTAASVVAPVQVDKGKVEMWLERLRTAKESSRAALIEDWTVKNFGSIEQKKAVRLYRDEIRAQEALARKRAEVMAEYEASLRVYLEAGGRITTRGVSWKSYDDDGLRDLCTAALTAARLKITFYGDLFANVLAELASDDPAIQLAALNKLFQFEDKMLDVFGLRASQIEAETDEPAVATEKVAPEAQPPAEPPTDDEDEEVEVFVRHTLVLPSANKDIDRAREIVAVHGDFLSAKHRKALEKSANPTEVKSALERYDAIVTLSEHTDLELMKQQTSRRLKNAKAEQGLSKSEREQLEVLSDDWRSRPEAPAVASAAWIVTVTNLLNTIDSRTVRPSSYVAGVLAEMGAGVATPASPRSRGGSELYHTSEYKEGERVPTGKVSRPPKKSATKPRPTARPETPTERGRRLHVAPSTAKVVPLTLPKLRLPEAIAS